MSDMAHISAKTEAILFIIAFLSWESRSAGGGHRDESRVPPCSDGNLTFINILIRSMQKLQIW